MPPNDGLAILGTDSVNLRLLSRDTIPYRQEGTNQEVLFALRVLRRVFVLLFPIRLGVGMVHVFVFSLPSHQIALRHKRA